MTKPRNELVFAGHMLDEARKLAERFANVDRDSFDANEDLQLVALHRLQVIGEAATRLSDDFKAQHPEIPWPKIIGMRHRLVHDYFNVNFDVVWRAVREFVPELIGYLAPIVDTDDN